MGLCDNSSCLFVVFASGGLSMTHLRKGEISAFLAGTLSPQDFGRVIRHLLGGCSLCTGQLEAQADLLLQTMSDDDTPQVAADPEYDAAISRALVAARSFEDRWREESETRDRALALLADSPGGMADLPAQEVRAAQGWPLCEALLQKSFEERYRNPRKMLLLAEQAGEIAERTPVGRYPSGFVSDLRARSWAELGNAYRINDQFAAAEAAFARADSCLRQGSGDILLLARVLDLEASLRSAQRRLDEAIALLEKVHELYLEAGDRRLAGRALISRGSNVLYAGEARSAVELLREGLELIDPEADRRLHRLGLLNVIDALAECGAFAEAGGLLAGSGLRKEFAEEPLNLLKLLWVEGKIDAGLGRLEGAGEVLLEVRRRFRDLGQEYDAALVGLELGAVWLRLGRAESVRTLAEEMYETFQHLGVHQEAARALYFVREACRLEAVTASLMERVRTFLIRLAWQPGLRFEPAAFG
jgi:tetratricopeptide (TPR) repeat protein